MFLVVGDIVKSRSNAKKAHKDFNYSEKKINKKYELVYPFTITLGDEFQLLVKEKNTAISLVKSHENIMLSRGWKMRYVIIPFPDVTVSFDVIKTKLNCFNPLATPELTIARKHLEIMKEIKDSLKILRKPTEKQRKNNLGLGIDYASKRQLRSILKEG